jgi:hypothetical protein
VAEPRWVQQVRLVGGEVVITLTPAGLRHARGRRGAREVARQAVRVHLRMHGTRADLRPYVVPELSGEIRAHALAAAWGFGWIDRRANPVNVRPDDYRRRRGDSRFRALG